MKKLQLPPTVLNGTPLTESEMKEILGGMQYYQRCSCTVYKNKVAEDHQLPMTSATTCSEACKEICDRINATSDVTGTSCPNYDYTFTVGRY